MDELLSIRADSVERFLRRWYGFMRSKALDGVSADSDVPSELVEWHAAAALTGASVAFQDRPIELQDLSREPDGMLPFWVENQRGYYWAVNLNDDEREVFCRESGSTAWDGTGEDLGRFLLHCTVREAVIGAGRKFTTFVAEPVLDAALESFSLLDFTALAHEEPETQLWCSTDALARLTVPPVGYGRPDERLWMLTIAVPRDSDIKAYGSRFGLDIPDEMDSDAADVLDEAPPF